MNAIRSILLSTALLSAAAVAHAGPGRDFDRGMRPIPSAEMLATIPGLSTAQQQEMRRIAIEQRDAHEALRIKERAEHERIDERSDERIRKLLGEEGFRKYAEWKQTRMRGPHPGLRDGDRRGDGPGKRRGGNDRVDDNRPAPPREPAAAE